MFSNITVSLNFKATKTTYLYNGFEGTYTKILLENRNKYNLVKVGMILFGSSARFAINKKTSARPKHKTFDYIILSSRISFNPVATVFAINMAVKSGFIKKQNIF